MIRYLPVLLTACLAGVETPVLLRTHPSLLAYDLTATSPWMPLLWDRCTLSMTTAQNGVRITASLLAGSGIGSDATDQLALRDGHRLVLAGTAITVVGDSRSWNGTWSGGNDGTPLVINLPAQIDAQGVLLACRQICYANLGGARTLLPRRIGIVVRCDTVDSAALPLDVTPGSSGTAPMLRLDDVRMTMDESPVLRHHGWYDSHAQASDLRWEMTQCDDGVSVVDPNGASLTGEHDLVWLSTGQLLLNATQQGTHSVQFNCRVGLFSRNITQVVTIGAAQYDLQVIGDFPFSVNGATDLTFLTSDANTVLSRCIEHPAMGSHDIANPFTTLQHGRTLILRLNPPAGVDRLDGCAVFSNGTASYRLPYRIMLNRTVAN